MYKHLEQYIYGSAKSKNLSGYILDMSTKLFDLKNKPNNTEISKVNINNIIPFRFYLIRYNYNGNKIWCPIFAMDHRVNENKHILYAMQLEYLPPLYKIKFFDLLFSKIFKQANDIINVKYVVDERPLKLNFQFLYNSLKNNGNMNFCITAFDFSKITETYLVSLKILPEILMCDTKKHNSKSMKDLYNTLPQSNEKDTLKSIIEKYDEMINNYKEDSIQYHKELSKFDKYFKLVK